MAKLLWERRGRSGTILAAFSLLRKQRREEGSFSEIAKVWSPELNWCVDPLWKTKRTSYTTLNAQERNAYRHSALASQRLCPILQAIGDKLQRWKGEDMEDVSEIRSQTELNRLRWRSRRGMAELDVLFVPFFEEAFDALSADMKEVYARMLDEEDPELWSWFSEQSAPDDPQYRSLVSLMLNRVRPNDS